jgi:hypothetical protein
MGVRLLDRDRGEGERRGDLESLKGGEAALCAADGGV